MSLGKMKHFEELSRDKDVLRMFREVHKSIGDVPLDDVSNELVEDEEIRLIGELMGISKSWTKPEPNNDYETLKSIREKLRILKEKQ